jgi:hypothetical protein
MGYGGQTMVQIRIDAENVIWILKILALFLFYPDKFYGCYQTNWYIRTDLILFLVTPFIALFASFTHIYVSLVALYYIMNSYHVECISFASAFNF